MEKFVQTQARNALHESLSLFEQRTVQAKPSPAVMQKVRELQLALVAEEALEDEPANENGSSPWMDYKAA